MECAEYLISGRLAQALHQVSPDDPLAPITKIRNGELSSFSPERQVWTTRSTAARGPAAIDHVNSAGAEAAVVAGQEQHQPGDLLGISVSSQRYTLGK